MLDGHSSRVYNMEFLNLIKESNVYVLWSATTHHTHPAASRQEPVQEPQAFLEDEGEGRQKGE